MEYQQFQQDNLPGILEIVELENEHEPLLEDSNDPDYEPEDTSARARGDVVRKRKVAKERARSKSRGRKTRSQSKQSEITVD